MFALEAKRILFEACKNGVNPTLLPVAIANSGGKSDCEQYLPMGDTVTISFGTPVTYKDSFEQFMSADTYDEKNQALHQPLDEGMRQIADLLSKEFKDVYFPLVPKKFVSFPDGRKIDLCVAENPIYIRQYEEQIKTEAKKLIYTLDLERRKKKLVKN